MPPPQRSEDPGVTQPSICPHRHLPQVVSQKPSDPPGEGSCPNCGGPVPWGPAPATQPPTVLCIDDDPLVLHFYRAFLAQHGFRVLTATDGLQGLALATQDRPDVVLLDIMLRGLSGYDICRKFRTHPTLGSLPVILITVWDQANVATVGHDAGATLTLRKPADAETLLTAIAQVLGQWPDPAEAGA